MTVYSDDRADSAVNINMRYANVGGCPNMLMTKLTLARNIAHDLILKADRSDKKTVDVSDYICLEEHSDDRMSRHFHLEGQEM